MYVYLLLEIQDNEFLCAAKDTIDPILIPSKADLLLLPTSPHACAFLNFNRKYINMYIDIHSM